MVKPVMTIAAGVLLSVLTACSGGNSAATSTSVVPPAFVGTPHGLQDTREIAGLYDASTSITDEVAIAYLAIDNNGNGFFMEHVAECYQTSVVQISNLGDGSYIFSSDGEPGDPLSLNASNEQLFVSVGQQTAVLPRVEGLNPSYVSACTLALPVDVLGIGAPLLFPDALPGFSPPPWVTGLPASGGNPPTDNNGDSMATSDTSRISGLWDSSSVVSGVLDTFYFSISDTGEYIEYDYLGDDFDQGPNCYRVAEFVIGHLGDDRYLFNLQFELIAVKSNNTLSITDTSTGETTIYQMATNFDSSVPNCN